MLVLIFESVPYTIKVESCKMEIDKKRVVSGECTVYAGYLNVMLRPCFKNGNSRSRKTAVKLIGSTAVSAWI